jgi:hypothetical protein
VAGVVIAAVVIAVGMGVGGYWLVKKFRRDKKQLEFELLTEFHSARGTVGGEDSLEENEPAKKKKSGKTRSPKKT